MSWWEALILGVVEGLTEYLPVSSTAHLILTQRALGIENDAAARAYAICIQAGAIVAVLGVFARRVGRMLRGLVGHDPQGLRLALQLLVAFAPAAVAGLLIYEHSLVSPTDLSKLNLAFFNVNGYISVTIFAATLTALLLA